MKLKPIAFAAAVFGAGVAAGAGVLLGVVWLSSGPRHKKGGAR